MKSRAKLFIDRDAKRLGSETAHQQTPVSAFAQHLCMNCEKENTQTSQR